MYAVKAAMLCFYTKLFPLSMTKTRVCLWITVLTTIIGFVVSTMLNLLLCFPISRNWYAPRLYKLWELGTDLMI